MATDYIRAWRAEHVEDCNSYRRRYRATDKGYAMERAHISHRTAMRRNAVIDSELTNPLLAAMFAERENCDWCGNPVPPHDRIIDHKRAIYFGGEHTASNIQILCKPCDKKKTGKEQSLINKLRGATRSDFALAA